MTVDGLGLHDLGCTFSALEITISRCFSGVYALGYICLFPQVYFFSASKLLSFWEHVVRAILPGISAALIRQALINRTNTVISFSSGSSNQSLAITETALCSPYFFLIPLRFYSQGLCKVMTDLSTISSDGNFQWTLCFESWSSFFL